VNGGNFPTTFPTISPVGLVYAFSWVRITGIRPIWINSSSYSPRTTITFDGSYVPISQADKSKNVDFPITVWGYTD